MKAVVIGGGIAGCSVAALLAEGGADVTLYERDEIAAGASGRNSGLLQHPMDEPLVPLYEASLELYATLDGFELPPEPVGTLVVSGDGAALSPDVDAAAARFPELRPEWLEGAALATEEPALGDGLYAYRLHTGRPVPPAAATRAWAERARRAGAEIVVGAEATVAQHPADVVIVAAGPWTPHALGAPGWRPVGPLWGVVAQVALATPPRHAIEQAGVEALTDPDNSHDSLFSIVTLNDASAVGSTFTPAEPEPATVAPRLLERGARYVPALERATIEAVRACARPLSIDGRPLIGPVGDGVHVLTGHGPWGVSLGPGSAQLLADVILGRRSTIPPELAAARFPAP